MIRAPRRPYGPVMMAGSPVKLKGAVLLQPMGQWPYWAQFWRDWDWPTIARTIDRLAGLGMNCLQFTLTGLDDNGVTHPTDAVVTSRLQQLSAYAAGRGMVLNPQLGYQPSHTFGTSRAVGVAAAVRMAGLCARLPNVAFVDAMNEVNFYGANGWSGPNAQAIGDLSALVGGVRGALGPVPVTLSVGCSALSDVTGSWMQAVAPLCSFHNLHTYYYGSVSGGPSSADFAALRSASWYLGRFIVGETGMPSQNGSAAQTAWMQGNGATGSAADCLGSIVWGATDTSAAPGRGENVSNFGILDSTGSTVRPALSSPIAAWNGVL